GRGSEDHRPRLQRDLRFRIFGAEDALQGGEADPRRRGGAVARGPQSRGAKRRPPIAPRRGARPRAHVPRSGALRRALPRTFPACALKMRGVGASGITCRKAAGGRRRRFVTKALTLASLLPAGCESITRDELRCEEA